MIPVLSTAQAQEVWRQFKHPAQAHYLAFYSSVLKGITKDPAFMTVPVDDHLVHRGDGVFEALKCLKGRIYLWRPHFERMKDSAAALGLKIPSQLQEIVIETVKASGEENCIIRMFLARGPGEFSANPYDSIGEQLYVMVTKLIPLPASKYEKGARIGRSQISPKESWLAQIKTCNYIPNVMMKKEAVDRQIDFTVGRDREGFFTEGSTENLVMLTKEGDLVRPMNRSILKGTTMLRVFDMARALQAKGEIRNIQDRDLNEKDLLESREVMMIGTTLDVLPVVSYEGKNIADGQVGTVAKQLLTMLKEDQVSGHESLMAL